MFGQLMHLLGGWREIRASGGFSYQVSRGGRRRVVPIEGYRNRTVADQGWVATGTFADDGISERFRNFSYRPRPGAPRRERPSRVDFGLGR
jgi:hypothetical protein